MKRAFNRKGGIDQIITTPVVLILIILMGFIFILVSSGLGKTIGPENTPAVSPIEYKDSLLFEKIEVDGREMWVVEAIVKTRKGDLSPFELSPGLKRLLNEEKRCLLLATSTDLSPVPSNPNTASGNFYFKYHEGRVSTDNPGSVHQIFQRYKTLNAYTYLFLYDGADRISVAYYYGKCLEDGNEQDE